MGETNDIKDTIQGECFGVAFLYVSTFKYVTSVGFKPYWLIFRIIKQCQSCNQYVAHSASI